MKSPHECTDRELLIEHRELLVRIDERTKGIPELAKKVNKGEIMIAVLTLSVFILAAKTFPALADFIGR